jgi:segregation and condensation protein B
MDDIINIASVTTPDADHRDQRMPIDVTKDPDRSGPAPRAVSAPAAGSDARPDPRPAMDAVTAADAALPADAPPPADAALAVRVVPQAPSGAADASPARIVEALLFSSDAPLSAARLAELLGGGTARDARRIIDELNAHYESCGLSFRIQEIARGFQMLTLPAFAPYLSRLNKHRMETRLSEAAMETLSIIAYKQPIIRADIEAIRGVACGDLMNRLREMGLVRIVGRAEIVGRPMLYGTTRKFLDTFGLADLDDLPPMEALAFRRGAPAVEPPEAPPAPVEEARAVAGA